MHHEKSKKKKKMEEEIFLLRYVRKIFSFFPPDFPAPFNDIKNKNEIITVKTLRRRKRRLKWVTRRHCFCCRHGNRFDDSGGQPLSTNQQSKQTFLGFLCNETRLRLRNSSPISWCDDVAHPVIFTLRTCPAQDFIIQREYFLITKVFPICLARFFPIALFGMNKFLCFSWRRRRRRFFMRWSW